MRGTAAEGQRGTAAERHRYRNFCADIGRVAAPPRQPALAAAEAWAERMLEREEGVRLNILLDNLGPELSRDAVLDIETRGLREYVTIEASGNITFDDLESWRTSKVDVISTSSLHRAAPPLDLTCIFEGV